MFEKLQKTKFMIKTMIIFMYIYNIQIQKIPITAYIKGLIRNLSSHNKIKRIANTNGFYKDTKLFYSTWSIHL